MLICTSTSGVLGRKAGIWVSLDFIVKLCFKNKVEEETEEEEDKGKKEERKRKIVPRATFSVSYRDLISDLVTWTTATVFLSVWSVWAGKAAP